MTGHEAIRRQQNRLKIFTFTELWLIRRERFRCSTRPISLRNKINFPDLRASKSKLIMHTTVWWPAYGKPLPCWSRPGWLKVIIFAASLFVTHSIGSQVRAKSRDPLEVIIFAASFPATHLEEGYWVAESNYFRAISSQTLFWQKRLTPKHDSRCRECWQCERGLPNRKHANKTGVVSFSYFRYRRRK